MLREEDKKQIQQMFKDLRDPVNLFFFTQQIAGTCQYCLQTEQLLKELTVLSDRLVLSVSNFVTDRETVSRFGVDKIPALAIQGKKEAVLRFYGMPTGYEFATLLEAIMMASKGEPNLPEPLLGKLNTLKKPVHIQVLVTPTCPYCTKAAVTAYRLAMASSLITADVVEVTEFPHLVQKYAVMGVPKVMINDDKSFEGALPEAMFIDQILQSQS